MDRTERNRRVAAASELFVETPRTRKVFERISDLYDIGRSGHETRCMLLLGPTGAGKSLTTLQFADLHPPSEGEGGMCRPVLTVGVPARCTLRSLAGATLDALGDIIPGRGSEVELTARVRHHLKHQGVRLLVFDDIQHLISKKNDQLVYEAADWIKGLLWANLTPVLLVGQPEAERVIHTNPQLRRRTMAVEYLDPYDWNLDADRLEYRTLLDTVDGRLGFPQRSNLGRTDSAIRLHHFSRGLLGETMLTVVTATQIAVDEDRPCLTHEILARAVDELLLRHPRNAVNPFRLPVVGRPADPAPRYDDVVARAKDAERLRRTRRGEPDDGS